MKICRAIYGVPAAAILAASVSCTQEMVVYEDSAAEIGFTPVTGTVTKIVPGAVETEYSEYESFGVFAYHKTGVPAGTGWQAFYAAEEGTMVEYLGGVPFCKRMQGADGSWTRTGNYWGGGYNDAVITFDRNADADDYVKGTSFIKEVEDNITATPYYWPKSGSMMFAGYSPYKMYHYWKEKKDDENGDEVTVEHHEFTELKVSYSVENGDPCLTVTDFVQGRFAWEKDDHFATNETVDLMWFDVDDAGSLSADASTVPSVGAASAVPVVFHHACSWLDFRIRAKDAEAANRFVILQIVLGNVYDKGTFRSSDDSGAPAWSDLNYSDAAAKDLTLYYNFSDGENDRNPDGTFFSSVDESGFFIGHLMIIPQDVDKGSAGKSGLTIYYKQLSPGMDYEPDENADDVFAGNPQTQTFTYGFDDTVRWETGKHYTYDIVFGVNEIQFSPTVDTEWGSGSGTVVPVN